MRTKAKASSQRHRHRSRRRRATPNIEMYSDERVAEFLLSNSVDEQDYARAVRLVRKMGLNPEHIDHDKPVGVR